MFFTMEVFRLFRCLPHNRRFNELWTVKFAMILYACLAGTVQFVTDISRVRYWYQIQFVSIYFPLVFIPTQKYNVLPYLHFRVSLSGFPNSWIYPLTRFKMSLIVRSYFSQQFVNHAFIFEIQFLSLNGPSFTVSFYAVQYYHAIFSSISCSNAAVFIRLVKIVFVF